MKKTYLILASLLILPVLLVPAVVAAEDTETTTTETQSVEKQAEQKKKREEKRKEGLKKACENRRESFKKRMEGIAERSQKRLEVFDKIAEKVEAFNEEKNLNVENYDQLLADVKAKRQAVHDAHEAAKENAGTFDCEGDHPKQSVESFKTTLHNEIDAFKAYKKSLKALIAAVRAAAVKVEDGANNENQ
jgi:hypothetical protein